VLVSRSESIDRVRALASGIDTIIPVERVPVDLPTFAKTLARIGSPPPRVLLVENDLSQAETLIQWLEQANAKVTHCLDGIAAREAMIREVPDLILTDTRLPGINGLSLARLVRQDSRFGLTPIVFLTHHDTVADQIEALSAGADHFLTEPVDRELLTHLVINRAERGRRLREMVHRDGLTGLLNHATLMAELEHAVEYARRHGETFAFLMIDGRGDPNASEEYQDALQALYGVAYTLKFTLKKAEPERVFKVAPLEGLWWADEEAPTMAELQRDRDAWNWTMMIAVPDAVTAAAVAAAAEAAGRRRELPAAPGIRLERFAEGLAVQIMHVGPYADEAPTIERLHAFAAEQGYELRGRHHEIYLGDPRTAKPENLKTVLRHAVTPVQ